MPVRVVHSGFAGAGRVQRSGKVMSVKVGVVGVGAVGSATVLSLIERGGACREIVLVDRDGARAQGVAADMRYATPLSPTVEVHAGGFEDLSGADLVILTAGVNEKNGGATGRGDSQGRLRLVETNARVFADIVPKMASRSSTSTQPASPSTSPIFSGAWRRCRASRLETRILCFSSISPTFNRAGTSADSEFAQPSRNAHLTDG